MLNADMKNGREACRFAPAIWPNGSVGGCYPALGDDLSRQAQDGRLGRENRRDRDGEEDRSEAQGGPTGFVGNGDMGFHGMCSELDDRNISYHCRIINEYYRICSIASVSVLARCAPQVNSI